MDNPLFMPISIVICGFLFYGGMKELAVSIENSVSIIARETPLEWGGELSGSVDLHIMNEKRYGRETPFEVTIK